MSKYVDIVDGKVSNVETLRSGLVYTCVAGWVDLGHARPDNAARLWNSIDKEHGEGVSGGTWYGVGFGETESKSLWKVTVTDGVSRRFAVRHGLTRKEKESVALAIFLEVSLQFESLQADIFHRLATDSGYSAEDLVSNLIGFYRAVRPGRNYVSDCQPVSKAAAQAVWNSYGPVGALKNTAAVPFIFPCKECPGSPGAPVCGVVPPFLSDITPASSGDLYRAWDPKLFWEKPSQPAQLSVTLNYYLVQAGDSLSKIALREYGDMFLWPILYDANRSVVGSNPNIIHPGQKLFVPDIKNYDPKYIREAKRRGRNCGI